MKTDRTLWTRDFSLITFGTVISIIGGQVIQLPLSLTVFEKTGSVLRSSMMFVIGMIPGTVLPILVAPLIDRNRKKPVIVALDYLLAVMYFVLGATLSHIGFHYMFYVLISFLFGVISAIYSNAYQAWFPDLIPKGFEHKGYAISGTLYPSITIFMAPISAFLYKSMEMHDLFYLVGAMLLLAATSELFIRERFEPVRCAVRGFEAYREEMMSGFRYIRAEKGIRNIYAYMGITQGLSDAKTVQVQAFFQSSPWLGATLYGFLISAETIGRMLAGVMQYVWTITPKKRYRVTQFVYYTYDFCDLLLLFIPYPLMLFNRFVVGGLGMTSATVRQASVQSYLDPQMRAKVSAVFGAYATLMAILIQFIGGIVGDRFGYRTTVVMFTFVGILAIYLLISRPAAENRKVYEAERKAR